MKKNIELGKKLHTILTERNITIRGLADLTGFPISKVAKWCTGIKSPEDNEMEEIAAVMGMSKEELTRLLEE